MSEEFAQIAANMMTKNDYHEIKGMLVDVLAKLEVREDEHTVAAHQQQRTSDKIEEHDVRLIRVEHHLGFT